jgi:hypothetical protein
MISKLVNEGVMMLLMQTLSTSPKNSLESRSKLFSICRAKQLQKHGRGGKPISLIRIKKSPFSQFRKKQSKVNTSSTSHGKTRKDKTENKGSRTKNQKRPKKQKKKHKSGMDNSTSLTPAQAPLTVACRIVTSVSQVPH